MRSHELMELVANIENAAREAASILVVKKKSSPSSREGGARAMKQAAAALSREEERVAIDLIGWLLPHINTRQCSVYK